MLFTVADLEREAIDFDETLAAGSIDFIDDMRQVDVLHSAGHTDLLKEHRGTHDVVDDIRIRGRLETQVEVPCARCLELVQQPIDTSFDLIFRPREADLTDADRAISASETEIGYYEGDGLLLEDVLREQILLALPAKILCQEGCKGLCPQCGRNRNTDPCECTTVRTDPRWESLESIRSHVKS